MTFTIYLYYHRAKSRWDNVVLLLMIQKIYDFGEIWDGKERKENIKYYMSLLW